MYIRSQIQLANGTGTDLMYQGKRKTVIVMGGLTEDSCGVFGRGKEKKSELF